MKCSVCGVGLVESEELLGVCDPCVKGARQHGSAEANAAAAEKVAAALAAKEARARTVAELLLTTEAAPIGLAIKRRIDIVTAECVFGMNVLKEIAAGVTDFVGGRSGATQQVLRDARQAVLDDLRQAAHGLGANAVVGVTLNYSEFSGQNKSMIMVIACGTAVELDGAG